jgi:hypothetical protein
MNAVWPLTAFHPNVVRKLPFFDQSAIPPSCVKYIEMLIELDYSRSCINNKYPCRLVIFK